MIHKKLMRMQVFINQFHAPYRACSKIFISRIKNAFCLFLRGRWPVAQLRFIGPGALPLVTVHLLK